MTDGAALVTGASRGIGREIALRLAEDSPLVLVHYARNAEAADAVVQEICRGGGRAVALQSDLADCDGPRQLVAAASAVLAQPDSPTRTLRVLVCNAAVNWPASIEDVEVDQIDQIMALNVRAPLLLVKETLPLLPPGGRLIFLGSGATRFATPRNIAYASSKGAVDVMSRALAAQLGPRGVTVNVVAPGVVDTDMNAAWLRADETAGGWAAGLSALGRVGQPRDIADIVRFVASPEGGWMTGGWLDATGGTHL